MHEIVEALVLIWLHDKGDDHSGEAASSVPIHNVYLTFFSATFKLRHVRLGHVRLGRLGKQK